MLPDKLDGRTYHGTNAELNADIATAARRALKVTLHNSLGVWVLPVPRPHLTTYFLFAKTKDGLFCLNSALGQLCSVLPADERVPDIMLFGDGTVGASGWKDASVQTIVADVSQLVYGSRGVFKPYGVLNVRSDALDALMTVTSLV